MPINKLDWLLHLVLSVKCSIKMFANSYQINDTTTEKVGHGIVIADDLVVCSKLS